MGETKRRRRGRVSKRTKVTRFAEAKQGHTHTVHAGDSPHGESLASVEPRRRRTITLRTPTIPGDLARVARYHILLAFQGQIRHKCHHCLCHFALVKWNSMTIPTTFTSALEGYFCPATASGSLSEDPFPVEPTGVVRFLLICRRLRYAR